MISRHKVIPVGPQQNDLVVLKAEFDDAGKYICAFMDTGSDKLHFELVVFGMDFTHYGVIAAEVTHTE